MAIETLAEPFPVLRSSGNRRTGTAVPVPVLYPAPSVPVYRYNGTGTETGVPVLKGVRGGNTSGVTESVTAVPNPELPPVFQCPRHRSGPRQH